MLDVPGTWSATKWASRHSWNHGLRHGLKAAEYGPGSIGYGIGFLGRFGIEHTVKAGWWGTKGVATIGAAGYNNTIGRFQWAPNIPYPRLDRWSFPGNRRFTLLDWNHNPMTWPVAPSAPKYKRPQERVERENDYDRTNAWKSTTPHSTAWHMAHARAMQEETVAMTDRQVNQILNNPAAYPGLHDALTAVHPIGHANAGAVDTARQEKAYKALFDLNEFHVQLSHVEQYENLDMRTDKKLVGKLQAWENWMDQCAMWIRMLNSVNYGHGLLEEWFKVTTDII